MKIITFACDTEYNRTEQWMRTYKAPNLKIACLQLMKDENADWDHIAESISLISIYDLENDVAQQYKPWGNLDHLEKLMNNSHI